MKRIGLLTLAGLAVFSIALADGTGSSKGLKSSAKGKQSKAPANAAETGLVSIKLYDSGLRVVQLYGSPDEIQDVAQGTGAAIGPAGGAARGGGQQRGRGGPQGESAEALWNIPGVDWQPANFTQEPPPSIAGQSGGPQQGPPGQGNRPVGSGGGAPAAGGAAASGDNRVVYTRWVYRRGNSRYAFILNRYNQVIQIEAIGSNDPRVHTVKGVRYGAQFAEIVKKYGTPDGYEINGNTLVLRYLVKNKVAFRMNRLQTDGKHVVTGIVVAAGKM